MRVYDLDHSQEPPQTAELNRYPVESEWQLESWLVANPTVILDEPLLVFGRQCSLSSGIPDLLAVDRWGNGVVIEIKRGKSGSGSASEGSILSQPQEYARSLSTLSYDELEEIYREFKMNIFDGSWDIEEQAVIEDTLQDAYEDRFGRQIDEDDFNRHQRIVILAEHITRDTEHNARYLLEQGLLIQCVQVQRFEASDDTGDNVLVSSTVVDYPNDRVQPEDDTHDYNAELMEIRDLVFQELADPLQWEHPTDIAGSTSKRDLHFTSQHPDHPDPLIYRFEPRMVEQGNVGYKLCVWGADDGQEAPVRDFLIEQTKELEGFELRDTHRTGWVIGEKFVEVSETNVDLRQMADDLVDMVTSVHDEAIDAFNGHPAFVDVSRS